MVNKSLRKKRGNRAGLMVGCGFLAFLAFFTAFSSTVRGQTPVPVPTGSDSRLSEYLNELTVQSIAFKESLTSTFEQPLSGWFLQIANYLGFLVFFYFMLRKVLKGETTLGELKKQGIMFTFCLLGLIWCGDVNGDGKYGDLVNQLQGFGNSIAYGISPRTPQGNYLGALVNQQRIKFDENYEKFVENKMMVKIDAADMPIRYPGMQGIQKLAGLYTGRPLTDDEKKDVASSAFWLSLLFQFLNGCRWIVEGIDFILFFIIFLTVMAVRLFLPFAFAVVSDDGLAKRITFPFLWSTFTLTAVCPLIAQICRLLIFVCGNIGLGLSNSNPHFSFDPTTGTIVGNGNPEWTVLIAGFAMLLSLGFLMFSIVISYKLMQGALVEAVTGLATQMFGMAASTGIGIGVNTIANNLSQQADRIGADATQAASQTQADYSSQAQTASAQAAYESNKTVAAASLAAENITSGATATASRQSSFGSMVSGLMNVGAEKYEKSASSLADLNQNWTMMSSEQQRDSAMNALDMMSKNNDLFTREGQQRIRDEIEKLNLPGDQLNQALGMIPVAGSALKTLGVNGEALNPLLRSQTGQAVLGAMLSAATNGGIPTPLGSTIMQSIDTSKGIPLMTTAPDNSSLGNYTGDGAQFELPAANQDQPTINDDLTPAGTNRKSMPPVAPALGLRKPMSNASSLPAPQMSGIQRKNLSALNNLMRRDPQFMPALNAMTKRNGWNTNDALNLMALETANTFNPGIVGGDHGNYVGLIQFGEAARKDVGLPADVQEASRYLSSIKPSQQVPYIEKYMKMHEKMSGTKLDSLGKMYSAVGGGGGNLREAMKNDGIVFSANSPNAKNRAGYEANKKSWDVNGDKNITVSEYGKAAMDRLGAGVFFDANQATGSLRFYDPVTAKVMAAKFAREYELGRGIKNNEFNYAGKEGINSGYYDAKRGAMIDRYNAAQNINQNVAGIKENALRTNYGWSVNASDTILAGSRQSALTRNEGSLKSADITFAGAQKAAELSRTGQYKASEIQHDAAIRALNLKALSNGVSQIGGSVSHAVSELIERSSRL